MWKTRKLLCPFLRLVRVQVAGWEVERHPAKIPVWCSCCALHLAAGRPRKKHDKRDAGFAGTVGTAHCHVLSHAHTYTRSSGSRNWTNCKWQDSLLWECLWKQIMERFFFQSMSHKESLHGWVLFTERKHYGEEIISCLLVCLSKVMNHCQPALVLLRTSFNHFLIFKKNKINK